MKTVCILYRKSDGPEYSFLASYNKLFTLFGKVYVTTSSSLIYSLTHFGCIRRFDKKDCFNTAAEAMACIKKECMEQEGE